MRRAYVWLDVQAEQAAAHSRRKITPPSATDPPGITIKGQHGRPSILPQTVDYRLESRLGMKVLRQLGVEQDGGSSVTTVETLYHVLVLADHGSAGTVLASLQSIGPSSRGSRGASFC